MLYATADDFRAEFGERAMLQLTDRDKIGAVDLAVLQRALDRAHAEIDGYVASRYALPLPSVPIQLVGVACDLAMFYLHRQPSEDVIRRHDHAIVTLKGISRGEINLGLDAASKPEPTAKNRISFTQAESPFSGGKL